MEDKIMVIVESMGTYFQHYTAYVDPQDFHEIEKYFILPLPPIVDLRKYEEKPTKVLYEDEKKLFQISEDHFDDILDQIQLNVQG